MFGLALWFTLATTATPPTDIVHLRDGSRYHGELLAERPGLVVFRVLLADGVSGAVRHFPIEQVVRVERNVPRGATSRPAAESDAPAATDEAPDWEQVLREAFELLDDDDAPAALRALQRLVREAPAARLADLSAACRAARGVPLDVLLAATRVRVAAHAPDGGFRIPYATAFEREALGRLLAGLQAEHLARRCDGRTVAEWAADRAAYTAVQVDSRRLVAAAARAAAFISVRLRLDPRLEHARADRAELVRLSGELARLAAHVRALPGYTAPAEDSIVDPAELVVQQLAAAAATTSQPADTDDPPPGLQPAENFP